MPKAKSITIPISAIAKLSSNISRPTLYKIVRTKKDIVKLLLEKEKELTQFYDEIFTKYKKNVYKEKRIIRDLEKNEMLEIEKMMKAKKEKNKKIAPKAKPAKSSKTKIRSGLVTSEKKQISKVLPKVQKTLNKVETNMVLKKPLEKTTKKIKPNKEKTSQKSKQSI